jgi:DNA-binding response OmpR family regulator
MNQMVQGKPARIVVVDDEDDLRDAVVEYLAREGLRAVGAGSGAELDMLMAREATQLVVLDINMPGEDGFSIARRLRADSPVGIVMLTSRDALTDRIAGLEIGADDYIAKPFAPRELLARIRTVLRRLEHSAAPIAIRSDPAHNYVGAFWIDIGARKIRVDLASIATIEAAKDYVILHRAEGNFILRHTMRGLEDKLDPAVFMRVHRSVFVRIDQVVEIIQNERVVTATLRDGRTVPVAFDRRNALQEWLEKGGSDR